MTFCACSHEASASEHEEASQHYQSRRSHRSLWHKRVTLFVNWPNASFDRPDCPLRTEPQLKPTVTPQLDAHFLGPRWIICKGTAAAALHWMEPAVAAKTFGRKGWVIAWKRSVGTSTRSASRQTLLDRKCLVEGPPLACTSGGFAVAWRELRRTKRQLQKSNASSRATTPRQLGQHGQR